MFKSLSIVTMPLFVMTNSALAHVTDGDFQGNGPDGKFGRIPALVEKHEELIAKHTKTNRHNEANKLRQKGEYEETSLRYVDTKYGLVFSRKMNGSWSDAMIARGKSTEGLVLSKKSDNLPKEEKQERQEKDMKNLTKYYNGLCAGNMDLKTEVESEHVPHVKYNNGRDTTTTKSEKEETAEIRPLDHFMSDCILTIPDNLESNPNFATEAERKEAEMRFNALIGRVKGAEESSVFLAWGMLIVVIVLFIVTPLVILFVLTVLLTREVKCVHNTDDDDDSAEWKEPLLNKRSSI